MLGIQIMPYSDICLNQIKSGSWPLVASIGGKSTLSPAFSGSLIFDKALGLMWPWCVPHKWFLLPWPHEPSGEEGLCLLHFLLFHVNHGESSLRLWTSPEKYPQGQPLMRVACFRGTVLWEEPLPSPLYSSPGDLLSPRRLVAPMPIFKT